MIVRWQRPVDAVVIARDIERSIDKSFLGVKLPSGESATEFLQGEPGSTWRLLSHYLARSAILGAGLAVAGARGKELVKYSLAGGAAIEAFVLAFAWLNRPSKKVAK